VVVPAFFDTIENSGFSTWLRESELAFYFVLTVHTIGLAMLVGPNAAIDLRILGVAREIPLAPLKSWFKIMWLGFAINTASGIFLLVAYPTKAATNTIFYVKLALIVLAVWVMQKLKTRVFANSNLSETLMEANGKALAMWSLVLWAGAIMAGRLLAYTFTYLLYGVYAPGG